MGELSINASHANTDFFSLSIHKLAANTIDKHDFSAGQLRYKVNAFEKPLHPFSLNTYILKDINKAKNDCSTHVLLYMETVLLSKEKGAVYTYQFTEKGEERVLYDTLKKRFEDEPNESKKLEKMIQKSYGGLRPSIKN
ncbi:hypothetical protein ACTFIR_005765 [Dictyostelium discoideum]